MYQKNKKSSCEFLKEEVSNLFPDIDIKSRNLETMKRFNLLIPVDDTLIQKFIKNMIEGYKQSISSDNYDNDEFDEVDDFDKFNKYELFVCNINEINELWKHNEFYICDDINKLNNKYKYMQSRIDLYNNRVKYPPKVRLANLNNLKSSRECIKIKFNNGKNRFSNLRDMGSKYIPILIPNNDINIIKKHGLLNVVAIDVIDNKINLYDKFKYLCCFINRVAKHEEFEKDLWKSILKDFFQNLSEIIKEVSEKSANNYDYYVYTNNIYNIYENLIDNGDSEFFMKRINEIKYCFSKEVTKLIHNSLDMITNKKHRITNNDDIRMLYFYFVKKFIIKFVQWNNLDLNDIKVGTEIVRFNELLNKYKLPFNKEDNFQSITSKIKMLIDKNERQFLLDIIDFFLYI